MALFPQFRTRARTVVPAVAGLLTLGYFAWHAVNGERGLLAYWRLQEELADAQTVLADTERERLTLEHQLSLLPREHGGERDNNLSLDMLAERARLLLGHIRPGELVIFDPPAPQ